MQDSNFRVGIELVATLPASADSQPFARVQQVVTVPGAPDTLAALDDRGVVWLFEDGIVLEAPFADLRGGAGGFERAGNESGLRSIAFHPDFADADAAGFGKVYLAYGASVASAPAGTRLFPSSGEEVLFHDVVAEFTVAGGTIDPNAGRELLRIEQSFGNHNFGALAFDPALSPGDAGYGLLHMGIGDGGGANDPLDAASDLSLILGKIVRIDPLGGEGSAAYAVPPGNPFVGTADALPEILAYGFRNPQTLAFLDGALLTGDIGQSAREEIDLVRVGGHHGWDVREGTRGADPDETTDFQYPIVEYTHDAITAGNAAVAGGFAYAGDDVPALDGAYVFGNFPTGEMFAYDLDRLGDVLEDGRVTADETAAPVPVTLVAADGSETSFAEVAGNARGRVDLRFGQDANGEILAFSKQTGEIFRLTADPAALGQGWSDAGARTVAAFYEIALNRDGVIDIDGLNFWIDEREGGLSDAALTDAFLFSAEFGEKFGAIDTLDDRALVELLYRNTFDREGKAQGIENWTNALGRDDFDRSDLILAFAASDEFALEQRLVATLDETAPGFWEFV